MPGLSDIARSFKKVTVSGVAVDVPGVSADGIAYLFARFPIIREVITGRATADLSPENLAKLAPEVIAALIACGTGAVDDAEAEKVAATLGLESQMDLLEAIVKETMPGGVGPFVERVLKTIETLDDQATNIRDGKLPSPSNQPSPTEST